MNFGIGQQLFAVVILKKKKTNTCQRGCRGNHAGMAAQFPLQPRLYVQISVYF